MPSLADLRRAYFNGGADAEYTALQGFYAGGYTFQDVLDAATAVHTTIPLWTPPASVLADQFERTSSLTAGSPDQGVAWSALSGTWGTADGHTLALVTHGGSTWDLVVSDLGLANVVVNVDQVSDVSPDAGIAVRVIDANNFWAVELVDTVINCFKVDGGVQTQMATATLGRTVTDAATTSGSATVTSATAAFTSADIGKLITAAGVPANTYIQSVTNGTTVVLTANATATATGVTLTVGTTTKSGTHNVKVCADLDAITVAVDSVMVLAYAMTSDEWTKYQGITKVGVWTTGTAEGTKWERISAHPVTMRTFYNGQVSPGTSAYKIGRAASSNGYEWFKRQTAAFDLVGGGWEQQVKDPCVVRVGSTWHMWYSGFNATSYQIGHATSTDGGNTWTRSANNPVVALGASGAFDNRDCFFPSVVYDPADTAAPFKMWYGAVATSGAISTIGYAESTDGDTWTKWPGNPVLRPGANANDIDALGIWPGPAFKIGSTYHLMYEARYVASNEYICNATFSTPKSRYSKDPANPIAAARRGATQLLTANLTGGSKTVAVANAAVFEQGEPVLISNGANGTTGGFLTRIQSIDSPTQVTLADPAPAATWTTAAVASIRSMFQASVAPRGLVQLKNSGRYRLFSSCFRVFSSDKRESSASLDADSPIGPYKWSMGQGLMLVPNQLTAWDILSAENPTVVPVTPS